MSATVSTQRPTLALAWRRKPLSGLRVSAPVWPSVFVAVNALAFWLLRPGVNDLWAARARASAVSHGVGLGYWFSWFGGGSTPGNYSVVTPYLCAWIGTEVVGALSAVALVILASVLVRDTRKPLAAAWVVSVATALNLWSGRVPFLLGSAIAVGALIAVRRRARTATVGLTLLSILASPVSGAFVALGLSGTFLTTRTRAYRPIIGYAVVTTGLALIASAVVFGQPGAEPFTLPLLIQVPAGLAVLWWAGGAPDHIRTTLWVTLIVVGVVAVVPNGMGGNINRFVFYCLPVVVVALSRASTKVAVLAVTPALLLGAYATANDLYNAAEPVSSVGYYTSLAARLDQVPDLDNYRVEVVNHGAHAGYDALLDHASLARGWETQEDVELNRSLNENPLNPVTYKVWLDNNAVGYVALPSATVASYPEYTLVESRTAKYLKPIWRDADWELFRVADPTPIVGHPAQVVARSQSSMAIRVPCACTLGIRLRWSKFLGAALQIPNPTGPGTVDVQPLVSARVINDGSGWTKISTPKPGTYLLRGSLRDGLAALTP